jgi:protein ImuB
MLWLALHFRLLPLDIFTRGVAHDTPTAIAEAPGAQAELIAVNTSALKLGVTCGMSTAAAGALAAHLTIIPRDGAREQATLRRIAAWGLQFTPFVSIAEPATVLLEIAGSLKLFHGLLPLHRRIRDGVRDLGLEAAMACAPTPLAAEWFARTGLNLRIQHSDALRHALGKLSVSVLGTDHAGQLARFGVHTLTECWQLPRAGLARRAGPVLLDTLDRALGLKPDPRLPYTPPRTQRATLPLPAPAENAAALLFAARRLLAELCGWLTAIGCGAQRPMFEFVHEKKTLTKITLELASASRELEHLVILLRERLERVALPGPVVEITLDSGRVIPLASRNTSFLPDTTGSADSARRFIEKLNARLGHDVVHSLIAWPDHRPELAWRVCEPGAHHADAAAPDAPCPSPQRPLWLLAPPRPLREINAQPHVWPHGGPLALIAGPERIEAGWWDGQPALRDYFIARSTEDTLLWIYRERGADARWFVHGVFG